MSIQEVENENAYKSELILAGDNIVVADFSANWCLACTQIFPRLLKMAETYSNAKFLKVDVEKCPEIATSTNIYMLPTFILYKNNEELTRIEGSNVDSLESKLKEQLGIIEPEATTSKKEFNDINSLILSHASECLNESSLNPMSNAFLADDSFLQSDTDEQLLLSVTFNQSVKIHSIIIKAPADFGPKNIKIFKNLPNTMAFYEVENTLSTQDLTLSPKDLEAGNPNKLRFVRFQSIKNIQIFVENNQSGRGRTRINYIGFIGKPLVSTNPNEIKPILGIKVGDDEETISQTGSRKSVKESRKSDKESDKEEEKEKK